MIEVGNYGFFISIVFELMFEDILFLFIHGNVDKILTVRFDLIFHMIHDLLSLSPFDFIQSRAIVFLERAVINKFQFEEIILIFRHRILVFFRTI